MVLSVWWYCYSGISMVVYAWWYHYSGISMLYGGISTVVSAWWYQYSGISKVVYARWYLYGGCMVVSEHFDEYKCCSSRSAHVLDQVSVQPIRTV